MSPSLYIAFTFIRNRKRSIVISLLGITLGVAFFICTQAQTQGFEKFYIQTVLGTSGAIVVQDRFQPRFTDMLNDNAGSVVSVSHQQPRKYYEGIANPDRVMRVVREFSQVIACAPVIEGNATLQTDLSSAVFRLQGIDLDAHLAATALRDQLIAGNLGDYRQKPNGLLVGRLLARRLQIKVGDKVTLSATNADARGFEVCGIVQTGDNLIDERRGYIDLKVARDMLNKNSEASFLIVKLRDPARAPQVADHLEQLLRHRCKSWQEREQSNLQVFRAIRLSAAITVSTIIVLAGFGIFNVLTLMILDKVRDIAILRSMGYRRGDISAIFLWQGLFVATLGSMLGCAIGVLLTWWISSIPVHIRGFIATDHFLVHWSWVHYATATVIAFAAALVASWFPARRAAAVAPVSILRGAGQ